MSFHDDVIHDSENDAYNESIDATYGPDGPDDEGDTLAAVLDVIDNALASLDKLRDELREYRAGGSAAQMDLPPWGTAAAIGARYVEAGPFHAPFASTMCTECGVGSILDPDAHDRWHDRPKTARPSAATSPARPRRRR
jgi:hypothetical protein